MCEILTNPYTSGERRRRAEIVRHKAMLWLATKARPPYRPGGNDDGERGPGFWFTFDAAALACGALDRADRQTLRRLLETLSRSGLRRGRVPVKPLVEARQGDHDTEYRRLW